MTESDLETRLLERFAKELNELRNLQQRLFKHFTRRCDAMAATISDLQTNLATLKTKLDAVIAKGAGAATAEQVDAANTLVTTMISEVDAANPPTPPA